MDTKFDPFGASMIRCGNKPESSNSFKIKFKYITNLNKNLYFFYNIHRTREKVTFHDQRCHEGNRNGQTLRLVTVSILRIFFVFMHYHAINTAKKN